MKIKATPKLIKQRDRAALRARARVKSATGPTKWSKSVRSWVVEFQNRDREESLPAFDSLFKETLPESN